MLEYAALPVLPGTPCAKSTILMLTLSNVFMTFA